MLPWTTGFTEGAKVVIDSGELTDVTWSTRELVPGWEAVAVTVTTIVKFPVAVGVHPKLAVLVLVQPAGRPEYA